MNVGLCVHEKFMGRLILLGKINQWLGMMAGEISLSIFYISALFEF